MKLSVKQLRRLIKEELGQNGGNVEELMNQTVALHMMIRDNDFPAELEPELDNARRALLQLRIKSRKLGLYNG